MPSVSIGQTSDNFYVYTSQMDHYYDSLIQVRGIGNMRGTGYSGYMRWKEEWSHIIGPSGSISEAQLRVLDFAQRYNNIKTTMPKVEANWIELGPIYLPENIEGHPMHAGIGRIHAVAFDPNNASHIFAMSPTGGLYYSFDGGENWNNGGTDTMKIVGVASLVVDPQNSDRWYIGTGDCDGASARRCFSTTDGVWRTINHGLQWNRILSNSIIKTPTRIRKLLMHPSDSNILFVVTDTAIYRTSNATATTPTWTTVLQGHFNDLDFKPGNPSVMFASGYWGDQLYFSNNTGTSFTKVTNTPFQFDSITSIISEFSSGYPNLLYIAEQLLDTSSGNSKIRVHIADISLTPYQWTTKGWVKFQYTGSIDTIYLLNLAKGFAISPTDSNRIFVGDCLNNPIVQSTDQGVTWTYMDGNYHIDIHHLLYSPANKLWAGTDGGISVLTDTGWVNKTKNIGVANLHFISGATTDSNYVLMGAYDVGSNMLNKTKAPEQRWKTYGLGDGTSCAIDPKTSSRFYVTSQSGISFWRYENYGQDLPVELTVPGLTDFFTWFKLSPVVDNTVFFVTLKDIYRSRNKGETWQPIATNIIDVPDSVKFYYKLYTAPNDSNTMYLRDLGKYWKPQRWLITSNANTSDPSSVTWSVFPTPRRGGDDMAIDRRNANALWIVHNNWHGDTTVLQFDGTVWHNVTYNLLNMQIWGLTSIVHDNLIYPNGRTFVGGFRGVYYLDDGTTQWTLMDGLPNVKINQLEIDYNSGKLRASTYGRGLWEAPIANAYCNEPVVITGDTTLAAEAISYCNLHVAPGAVFTITGKLHMAPGKMITVDTAAKLVLDGGTITGIRDQMWKGIEVWGNSSKSQSPASNQGWFKAMNNAVVENAITGLANIKTARSYDYTCTGGIIQANKTTFRNCSQSIMFYPFENRNLFGSIYGNVSGFGNCTFEINNNYTGTDTIKNIVSLDQVRGVDFAGCRFVNNCTSTLAGKTTGIFSFNSSFSVYSLLNCSVYPCFDTIHSEFSKLGHGIRALGAATTKTLKVDDAIFTECKNNGIYASSLNYITLTRNKFFIRAIDTNAVKPFGGAYLDTCTSYIIEENTFYQTVGAVNAKSVGLTINNSGRDNNQVYKNTFNNLDIGTLAQGQNKNPANNDGLCLRCNTFNSCKYDIAVTKPANGSNSQNGIALWQGSASDPVGNLFTENNQNLLYSFWNIGSNSSLIPDISYYHHSNFNTYPRLKPTYGKYTNLTPLAIDSIYNPIISCPSNLSGNPTIDDKLTYDFKADSINQVLTLLIDDGNTDQLVSDVIMASPADALELHDDLLLKSPYLSDTVMKEAIENEAVNNALLRDVLVANPQSAKSDDLMQAVEQRWDPMPDYMVDEILEGSEIISEKEKLEAERANYRFKSDVLYNRIIGNLIHDTLSPDAPDSAYALISQSQQLSHMYMQAVMAFEKGDTSMVAQLMDEIAGTFYPDGILPPEHQKALNFYNESKSMGLINIPAKSIDSTQSVLLMADMANNTLPDCWVRNLLTAAGRYSFEEQYILPDELKNTDIQPERVKNRNESTIFKVFPNPANQYAVFEYSLKEGEIMTSSCIQITDMQGKPCGCLGLKRPKDQVVFSTHNLKPGLYLCRLMNGGKSIKSVKLSLVR
jgi:hypothetical protein